MPAAGGAVRWSEAWFLKVTEGSAIRRIGHLRWLRNIAVALGNAPGMKPIFAPGEPPGRAPALDEHIEWAIAQQLKSGTPTPLKYSCRKNYVWSEW